MTNQDTARILDAAIKSLRTDIMPHLPENEVRIKFDHITRLLYAVSGRLTTREAGIVELLESSAFLVPNKCDTDSSIDELEQCRIDMDEAVCDTIPRLLDAASNSEQGIQELKKIIDCEKNYFVSQDAGVALGCEIVYRGGRIENENLETNDSTYEPINEATLTRYLCRRMKRNDVAAQDIRVIAGGLSKVTIFFDLVDKAAGSIENLVIRKDMPEPFMGQTVVDEFGLLEHLHQLNFPVAEPLWLEADARIFGGCFIVSKRVAGSSDSAVWATDPKRSHNACVELAKVLAKLHVVNPVDLGYSAADSDLSAGVHMERVIKRWSKLFHAKKCEPYPLQELPLVWLSNNIPKALYQRPARMVHGDVGFHNLMFGDDGQVTALLDWEFSVLGDSTQDMCFVRQFVEGIMPWSEFLDLYLSFGGVPICQDAEFFFELWSKVRNAIGCVDSRALFETVLPDEVKLAVSGHVFAPYMFVDQCESLIQHLKEQL